MEQTIEKTKKDTKKVSDLIGGKGRQSLVCRIDRSSYLVKTERKTISVETRDLMIDFAAYCMDMKNDDWHHSIDVDRDFAKESIGGFMESHYITVDIGR